MLIDQKAPLIGHWFTPWSLSIDASFVMRNCRKCPGLSSSRPHLLSSAHSYWVRESWRWRTRENEQWLPSSHFSFLSLHILDSFLRLLSLRLSPYHQRCKQRRQDGDMRREKSRGNRHLTKWEIMLRSHHFKRWRAECLIVLNSWYNLWI